MGVGRDHLQALYAKTTDPWNFKQSAYEQDKFAATLRALTRPHYARAFELGCGNGELARHLVETCDDYTGMDAVGTAIEAAQEAVPTAKFIHGFYPCVLPDEDFDLLVLSEILYFLDQEGLCRLASDIENRWPQAEVLCVNWLGETAHDLQGRAALSALTDALRSHEFTCVTQTSSYRIDCGLPRGQS